MAQRAALEHEKLHEVSRLDDPEFYARDPHPTFARLRTEAPVFWHDGGGFWAVSTYADATAIFRNQEMFLSGKGVNILDRKQGRTGEPGDGLIPADAEMLIRTDLPDHREDRRLLTGTRAFAVRSIGELEETVKRIVADVLDRIPPEEEFDFVSSVSVPVTIRGIGAFLDLPADDLDDIVRWSSDMRRGRESALPEDKVRRDAGLRNIWDYLFRLVKARGDQPRDDVISRMVGAARSSGGMTDSSVAFNVFDILNAGFGTPDKLLSGALLALVTHPGERRKIVENLENPEALANAREELLRWITPIPVMCRTAKEDTWIGKTPVRRGDYVAVLIASANRDEQVWPSAADLDVSRSPVPSHLSFGLGGHFCLGAPLARLELQLMLADLLKRAPNYVLAGPVERIPSTEGVVIAHMPMTLA
jgi:cytochrome P450